MRRQRRDRGFTLIELLIVVAIILTIVAMAIPKITASRIAANEASAIASLRAINGGELMFSSAHPDLGFSPDLGTLGAGSNNQQGANAIGNDLASGRKAGYSFTYTPGEKINGAIRSYTVAAIPDQVGTTGTRRFYTDESGTIHYNASGPADATSPELQ